MQVLIIGGGVVGLSLAYELTRHNLRFYHAESDHVLFYGKMTPDRRNLIFVAVSLDPFDAHETHLHFPLDAMGIGWEEPWEAEELLLSGERHF